MLGSKVLEGLSMRDGHKPLISTTVCCIDCRKAARCCGDCDRKGPRHLLKYRKRPPAGLMLHSGHGAVPRGAVFCSQESWGGTVALGDHSTVALGQGGGWAAGNVVQLLLSSVMGAVGKLALGLSFDLAAGDYLPPPSPRSKSAVWAHAAD